MLNVQRVERWLFIMIQISIRIVLIYLAGIEQQPWALALVLAWIIFNEDWNRLYVGVERMLFDPHWRDAHDTQGRRIG